MKLMKFAALGLTSILLSSCVYGPPPCPVSGPLIRIGTTHCGCPPSPCGASSCGLSSTWGTWGGPCTAYHPNHFYRCHNHKCVTYSPYAPNRCDPVPYYTHCKYTGCCQPYTPYL